MHAYLRLGAAPVKFVMSMAITGNDTSQRMQADPFAVLLPCQKRNTLFEYISKDHAPLFQAVHRDAQALEVLRCLCHVCRTRVSVQCKVPCQ